MIHAPFPTNSKSEVPSTPRDTSGTKNGSVADRVPELTEDSLSLFEISTYVHYFPGFSGGRAVAFVLHLMARRRTSDFPT